MVLHANAHRSQVSAGPTCRAARAGFRPIRGGDFPAATRLLNAYLSRYKLHQHFSEAEVRHFLTPREDLVYVYVVEAPDGSITDVCSFYCLPSSILNHHEHTELRAAYMCVPPSACFARTGVGVARTGVGVAN